MMGYIEIAKSPSTDGKMDTAGGYDVARVSSRAVEKRVANGKSGGLGIAFGIVAGIAEVRPPSGWDAGYS
jgi:hypothetical protein